MPAMWVELPSDAGRWVAVRLDLIATVIDNEGLHEEGDLTFCSRIIVNSIGFDPITDGYLAARAADVLEFLLRAWGDPNCMLLRYDGPRTQAHDLEPGKVGE